MQKAHAHRPYMGGLEASAVFERDALYPRHPSPFLVHFSAETSAPQEFEEDDLPTDVDLLANLMIAKHRGESLYGPKPKEAIGEPNWEDYLESVRSDIDWILDGENILTSPFYCVLNLCRWVMVMRSHAQIVPSKEEAALWALEHLPVQDRTMIDEALAAYRSSAPVKDSSERRVAAREWNRSSLLRFRDEVARLSANRS